MDKGLFARLAFWRAKQTGVALGVYVCADKLWVYAPATERLHEQWVSFELQQDQWQSVFAELASTFPMPLYRSLLVVVAINCSSPINRMSIVKNYLKL